jgi:predicted 2-oxoglutarate/Fe(II)-dependent dioxygenase YbiX
MPRRDDLHGDDVFVVHDFLSADECRHLITASEAAGYADAPVSGPGGPVMHKSMRNNDRVMIDDGRLAAELFARLGPFLPPHPFWRAVGLNERFRYYRYAPGQKFDWHFDGSFVRPTGERSRLTFMVYLNDGCRGGETMFNLRLNDDPPLRVAPAAGKALLFRHDVLHTGAVVKAGTKYVLRSDVMYARTPG